MSMEEITISHIYWIPRTRIKANEEADSLAKNLHLTEPETFCVVVTCTYRENWTKRVLRDERKLDKKPV